MGGYFSSSAESVSPAHDTSVENSSGSQEAFNHDTSDSDSDTSDGDSSRHSHDVKRKASDEAACDDDSDSFLHTPRKKKMKTTTEYIYQVLFVEGENSDVTIHALGQEWKLHRLYLRQCGFFESMFSGSWRESTATTINLDIPDENIDAEALSIAFGCLYRDDLTIEPVQVIPVLAAASLLQLDGLLQQCAAIMKETISEKTVCQYYECSVLYGLKCVELSCFEWFENNIMCRQCSSLLKHITPTLMQNLIQSPNLFVMQVEMDVYNLLKRWLFLQLMPSWNGNFKSGLNKQVNSHFKELIKREFGAGSQRTLLETLHASKYRPVFASLRLQHIIIDLTSTRILIKDRILPQEWLMPFFKSNWLTMLSVERDEEGAEPDIADVDNDVFMKHSLRCARILGTDGEYQWRWIGFNYGIDLVIIYSKGFKTVSFIAATIDSWQHEVMRLLIFKRNCNTQNRLLSHSVKRGIVFKVTASSLNDLGQVTYTKTTGVKYHCFTRDEELLCLNVDKKASYPLRISLNVLYYLPKPELSVSNLLRLPLNRNTCYMCSRKSRVAALTSAPISDTEDEGVNNSNHSAADLDTAPADDQSPDTDNRQRVSTASD